MKIASNIRVNSSAPLILYKAHLHWTCFLPASILMVIGSVSIPFVLIDIYRMAIHGITSIIAWGLFYLFVKGFNLFVETYFTTITVTKDYLTVSKGFLYRRETDLPIRKIQGSHLTIPLVGQCLNYGRLYVATVGFWCALRVAYPRKLRNVLVSISN
ncbi:PH domain-containing protein [Chryseobacterium sp. A321]